MGRFYTAIDPDVKDNEFCVVRDGTIVARCGTEDWSCAIQDALNMVDSLAAQAREMSTWPD
jgi:hypothetical protein